MNNDTLCHCRINPDGHPRGEVMDCERDQAQTQIGTTDWFDLADTAATPRRHSDIATLTLAEQLRLRAQLAAESATLHPTRDCVRRGEIRITQGIIDHHASGRAAFYAARDHKRAS